MDAGHWLARLRDKRLLIFDFDGTVADTSPLHAAAFARVVAPFGITVDYPSIAGLKSTDAMRQCLLSDGIVLDERRIADLVVEKQQVVRNMIVEGLQAMPGADHFLRWARSRYRLAMVTSGSRGTVTLALQALGYESWFDPLICSDDVAKSKPDPEGFLAVLSRTNTEPSEALVFEDSIAGVLASKNAQIECHVVSPSIGFSEINSCLEVEN